MKTYSTKLTTASLNSFCLYALKKSSRINCLIVPVLIDIVRNQGDSPANISERVTGCRKSTPCDTIIKHLVTWGYVSLVELSGKERIGITARRAIYLTAKGAERLGLK